LEKYMKIAVALSGGVDSSTAAVLLKNEGHDIIGITAILSDTVENDDSRILSSSALDDARAVADRCGFPFHVVDLRKDFHDQVIKPFCREYLNGRTPNPCVMCNPVIKFDILMRFAASLGYNTFATGHYANIRKTG
jgi:tRNA-specific 2-thiouridylase